MITHIEIKNYKSIVDAAIPLSPFTLLIGANGTGKSNFLELLKDLKQIALGTSQPIKKHINYPAVNQKCTIKDSDGCCLVIRDRSDNKIQFINENGESKFVNHKYSHPIIYQLKNIFVYSIDPKCAGRKEKIIKKPIVNHNGSGVVQVLDSLKTGDREDLFNQIEEMLGKFIPEIEKLSFIPEQDVKQLQVREKYIQEPIPVSALSDGACLIIILLTIMFQEQRPSIVCIEEIDRGLHPRLFGKIIELCFDLVNREDIPQIIATTHNPYLVDLFKGNENAVIIVEKEKGQTKFTTLAERLTQLEPDEEPLGQLWYSGFVGGVPKNEV